MAQQFGTVLSCLSPSRRTKDPFVAASRSASATGDSLLLKLEISSEEDSGDSESSFPFKSFSVTTCHSQKVRDDIITIAYYFFFARKLNRNVTPKLQLLLSTIKFPTPTEWQGRPQPNGNLSLRWNMQTYHTNRVSLKRL